MIIDGERIKELIKRAKREVVLCAPFIKAKVIATILEAAPQAVPVRIVTRWRPAEVAAGLSDLEVFDIANERPHTTLGLLHPLHAKLYLADDDCLVGSANLTASALGWRRDANLEILLPAHRSHSDVARLLERLDRATSATFRIRAEIENQATALGTPTLDESREIPPNYTERLAAPWLPRCAVPGKIFAIYQNPETSVVVEDTRADAIADLDDLLPPRGMDSEAFIAYVSTTLYQIPSFKRILESIPARLTDAQGAEMIANLRPDLFRADLQKQWHIVREWIGAFFHDRFEVAPESYVVRLRSS